MNEDKMRERFEAWARRSGRTDTQLRIGSNGEYAILGTQWEWMAWQAATRAAVPAWQPIETMPNDDGSWVVADAKRGYVAPYIRGVIHNNTGSMWDWQYGEAITHWMPLPPAPEESHD